RALDQHLAQRREEDGRGDAQGGSAQNDEELHQVDSRRRTGRFLPSSSTARVTSSSTACTTLPRQPGIPRSRAAEVEPTSMSARNEAATVTPRSCSPPKVATMIPVQP